MLREIHIGSFSKIITNYKPQLFGALTVVDSRPYNPHVQCYGAYDTHQNRYQLYLTEKELEPVLQEIQFIEKSPKILLIKTERDHIIIQEHIEETLYDQLLALQNRNSPAPFVDQSTARAILLSVKEGVDNYKAHGVVYNAINPRNIVRRGGEWQLSLAGLLLRNEKESPDYYKTDVKKQYAVAYALGTLLFKLLFGFVPFQKRRERVNFSFKEYLKYLDKEENKKALKIYYFADRLLEVSQKAKQVIEIALKGNATFEELFGLEYFSKDCLLGARKEVNPANREIKMLSLFQTGQHSLVMAAIEHHRKYPQERINSKLIYSHELSREEVVEHLKRHPVLGEVEFDRSFTEDRVKGSLRNIPREMPKLAIQYFHREEEFDPELDFPCRQLIKLIQQYQEDLRPQHPEQLQSAIKLYAFPYAMIFQLHKVLHDQPEEIVQLVSRLTEDLLQISQLHWFKRIQPLHHTELLIRSFEEIKVRFREVINHLYRHFLAEAIRKYNVRKEAVQYAERAKQKQAGLEYYRLCLKLMECSLLVRKEGRELDLVRIQTSARKELESDLNQLLRQYFPNKIELS